MVEETVADDNDAIAVLHFNPWLFGSADDLVARFFHELSVQLGRSRSDRLKDVAKALSSLGESLAPLSPVAGTFWAAKLLARFTDRWTKPHSLRDKRDHLRQVQSKSDSRVVVLIDDIDRLEPRETRELMRLVRLTSDLPNVVFLLAFDRRHVARSLGEDEADGQQYLDKIVQVSYDLPVVREGILHGMFLPWLDELIEGHDLTQLDKEVWGRVFYDVIKPLLGNLRDAKRYLSSISATLDAIGREVALADLLGMEALRILRPSTFDDLKTHAKYLVHPESGSLLFMTKDARNAESKEKLSAMLERAADERLLLDSVLEILFPATQGFLGRSSYGPDWIGNWRKQRRVACEEVLHVYLQAGLDEGGISSREVQELVEALTDEKKLTMLLDALDAQRFEAALERLEDFERDFSAEAPPVAVPLLVNRMGSLSARATGTFDLSPRFKASRVVYRLLNRIESPEDLAAYLPAMLGKIETLSGQFRLVEMVGHRKSSGRGLIGRDKSKVLEEQLMKRVESATANQLAEEWELFPLSLRIQLWVEGEDKVRLGERLRKHLNHDEFVLALLRTAIHYAHSNGQTEKRLFWEEMVEAFGEGLRDAVRRLGHSLSRRSMTQEDQETIDLALKYV